MLGSYALPPLSTRFGSSPLVLFALNARFAPVLIRNSRATDIIDPFISTSILSFSAISLPSRLFTKNISPSLSPPYALTIVLPFFILQFNILQSALISSTVPTLFNLFSSIFPLSIKLSSKQPARVTLDNVTPSVLIKKDILSCADIFISWF